MISGNSINDTGEYFSDGLLTWYKENKRILPWRNTRDPYIILLSEVILQQTRVEQGKEYFNNILDRYPTIAALAESDEEGILKLWQGLGYYTRARNLLKAAKQVMSHYDGKIPDNYNEIRQLKGVGEHTAAAVASFAFNLPHPVIDGNVFRVLARFFGLSADPSTSKGKSYFKAIAHKILPQKQSSTYNQAIMDFGAIQCVPGMPDCLVCPIQQKCIADLNNTQLKLPVKKNKIIRRKRYFNYLIIECNDEILIHKRTDNDIWKGMYDFPLIESDKFLDNKCVYEELKGSDFLKEVKWEIINISKTFKHVLTHQIIIAKFIEIQSNQITSNPAGIIHTTYSRLSSFAVPRLIEKYLIEKNKFS